MALPLPNLDDRTYADLVEEARALIPTYDSSWTDHNPSDPGITLIELFAWLVEMLIYRANRVPDQHLITFLKLLNGPGWRVSTDLGRDVRESVVAIRRGYRAVTCEDYEALAKEASPDVARAKCIPRRYLGAGTDTDRTASRPGHISIIIVPHMEDPAPQPSETLRQTVWNYLDPRRVLTTRHHIVGPVFVPVGAEVLIARRPDVPAKNLRDQVVMALGDFLHPLKGGQDGNGWPFGRDIYTSELYELLEGLSGLDYVPDIALSSRCPQDATRCVAATELWHEDGDLVGLGLAPHHLPQAQIDPSRIVISARFVPVHVRIKVNPAGSVEPLAVCRAVKSAVMRFFHPLHGGPDGTTAREITLASIRTLVRGLPEVDDVTDISLQSETARLLRDELGNVTGVRIETGELTDMQVTVQLG